MKKPEPIELENNLGPDAVTGEINRVPWMAYDVDEMDIYIAEKDAEIAELKKKLMPCLNGDCILTCEVVEKYGKENAELKAKLEEKDKEIRKLRRALWMARALRARDIQRWWLSATCAPITERACNVWKNVERKCRAKAEEYK